GDEQCDDGNNLHLDACNASCKFEQDQRIYSLAMQFGTDTTCVKNALGGAIGSAGQSSLQTSITSEVNSGQISALFAMLGISDLSGTNQPAFQLGIFSGGPAPGAGYNGASDLDWWYAPDANTIDG